MFLLDDMPVPLVHATYRIIRDCNSAFAELFGYATDELVGQSFSRLYPQITDFIRTGKLWQSQLGGGKTYYDERIMAGSHGLQFWCRVNGRSANAGDPFADAIYCFQTMERPVAAELEILTGRQKQILTMIAQGKTNANIALETNLSRRTVESHRARMLKATGMKNSTELVAWFSSRPARKD
ncbi:PAS domain S-box-containing protein [Rhizobium sp. PP-F2F-G48]|uniref:helix-turn-helix transcriptional regulator n=1 Tax=Rhizobium sp. PP-F2F-G48 TaxID=2135651 RepID=UPI00104A542A|nr:helix-turn-helix transcriptional regulator [Rhizobium sp. PP-F2F-G48]TCM49701.1 PAS domain S-box-containing protein [Rhizobium sp. PP-F2F-G48]